MSSTYVPSFDHFSEPTFITKRFYDRLDYNTCSLLIHLVVFLFGLFLFVFLWIPHFATVPTLMKCNGGIFAVVFIPLFVSLLILFFWIIYFMYRINISLRDTHKESDVYLLGSQKEQKEVKFSKLHTITFWMTKIISYAIAYTCIILFFVFSGIFISYYAHVNNVHNHRVFYFEELKDKVYIYRETNGLIHISASNNYDLFFAQGVIMAQERLWQMEFQRRVGQGRLSEIVGEAALETDKMSRTIGFYKSARETLKYLPRDTREILHAYCDGINAYLSQKHPLPSEFKLLSHQPEKWELADVIVWAKLMSWDLSSNNYLMELTRYKLLQKGFSMKRVNELYPSYGTWNPIILSHQDLKINKTKEEMEEIEKRFADNSGAYIPKMEKDVDMRNVGDLLLHFNEQIAGASNNWVIGGKLTKSGKPLLSNDPHLGLSSPSIWYLIHLHSEDGINAIGASLPGIPGVIIGRNDHISWGVTNSYSDVQDLFVIQEDENGKSYKYNGKSIRYRVRDELIKIKNKRAVTIQVKETVYGPIVNEIFNITGEPISLFWVSLQPNDTTAAAFQKIYRAKNWNEFVEALKYYVAPAQNFVFADEKNIGYYLPGRHYIRKRGHSGQFPVIGDGRWEYQGEIPFDKLPHVFNPPNDYIVRITPLGYEYNIALDYSSGFRAYQIQKLIESKKRFTNFTIDDMIDIQMDIRSPLFERIKIIFPKMKEFIEDPTIEEWRKKLEEWDGKESMESKEATLFESWFQELTNLPVKEGANRVRWYNFKYLINALLNDNDTACVDFHRMSCIRYAAIAFESVTRSLLSKYGDIPKWGSVMKSKFSHKILDSTTFSCLASLNIPNMGGTETINTSQIGDDFTSFFGVSYRQIIDHQSLNQSLFIHAPGQSGNLFSMHYNDYLTMWRDGKYLKMRSDFNEMTEEDIRHIITLQKP